VGKIAKKNAFLLIRHSKYSAIFVKNTLLQTAFSVILPTGKCKINESNERAEKLIMYHMLFFYSFNNLCDGAKKRKI